MVPGAVGGGAPGHVRAAARATLIVGLTVAAMGVFAATINPGDFQAQSQVEHAAAPAAYGGQPQQRCAATEAEVLDLRATALALVLLGAAQAMLAAAAGVALAGPLSLQFLGRFLALIAHFFAPMNAGFLYSVLQGAAVVAVGHCAGGYHLNFVIPCVLAAVSYGVLFVVSFLVTFCGWI